MSKDAWAAFLRWLDQAGAEELAAKQTQCLALLDTLTEPDLKASLRQMVRLIEEERLIRLGIQARQERGQG